MAGGGAGRRGVCEHLPPMISFRYHLITIVAIFLAIALGIVMGAAFVQDPLLAQLEAQTDQLSRENDRLEAALERAEARADASAAFSEEALARILAGSLEGISAVLLTQEGTSADDLDAARTAILAAGGAIRAELTVSTRIRAEDEGTRAALASALGEPEDADAEDLLSAAAEAIGIRLATGPGDGDDVLEPLISDGFISVRQVQPQDLPGVGGLGTLLVVVAGGRDGPSIEIEQLLLPVLHAYAAPGRWALAAQGTGSDFPFVTHVRADEELSALVSTVDHLDIPAGRAALVLAGADLVADGTVGHYGLAAELPLLPPPREP